MSDERAAPNNTDFNAIFVRYSQRLAELAHRNLSARLRRRVDGEDVAQSVLRTFFRRSSEGEFQLDESTDLWKLLVKITINKVHNRARHHQADKRDIDREMAKGEDDRLEKVISAEPGPQEAAELADQLEQLLAGLPPAHREIFSLVVQGYSRTDVAKKVGLSRMTVHRVLDLLRDKLKGSEAS